jgi:uncharacterized protein (DUF1800 family)
MPALPPLDKLNPSDAWSPWRPTAGDPWSRKWAAHLYCRAGFGASAAELAAAEKAGFASTLELLLNGNPGAADLAATLNDTGLAAAKKDADGTQIRGWWVYCMLHSGHPLREKLTLFWHNHFATSFVKVRDAGLMVRQNALFRTHALGRFEPMLQAVSRDPAMLLWLDSNSNVKGRPNENYGRELMELFSLGVGNYTERDIREAARAFTGWHTDGQAFKFNAAQHDEGAKTVLGTVGDLDGGDVVQIVLKQPAAARFLVRKLYTYFVSEISPPDSLLEPLCDQYRKSDYDTAALMRTMLGSRLFFSDHAFRKRIKSPVEYAVGAVRAIYRQYPDGDVHHRPIPHHALVKWLGTMGQALFAPPNVKGWPGSRTWLNTSTTLERDNFAAALASGALWRVPGAASGFEVSNDVPPPKALDPVRVLEEANATTAADAVRVLLDAYVPGGVRPAAVERLTAFLADGKPTGVELARRAREAVHAILTMPEYQLA